MPSGHWTRDIPGINGALAAIQASTGSTELQLPDLHGDIIATASLSETETKLHPTAETTEYGVPREGSTPAKYTWLGADERPTELPTGIIAMGARSYIPQLGRFLQEDPIAGGSANAYAYTHGDPVNSADPSGEYTATAEQWAYNGSAREAQEGVEAREAELAAIKAAEEQAAREEAERQAAAIAAARAAQYEAANWEEKYAMGGPSLLEIYASRGIYPGQEIQEGSGGGDGGGCSGDNACAASSSHEWVCTLSGAVVAAGVLAATGGSAGIVAVLAGGSFTAGCEMGSSSNRTYISGLPKNPSDCFNEWTLSKRTHEYDHRVEECYA